MSDQYYAVQFRSMHTGVHSVIIFSLPQVAEELLAIFKKTELFPENFHPEFDNPDFFVDMFEIDYRDIPRESHGIEVLYINYPENDVPDVYNY